MWRPSIANYGKLPRKKDFAGGRRSCPTDGERPALDRLSEPVLNFPARFLKNAANLMHNGATVNGEPTQANPPFAKSPAVPDV